MRCARKCLVKQFLTNTLIMNHFPLGGVAYLKEPERNGDYCGTIISKQDGMVRLDFASGRQGSYFYSELL